MYKLNNKDVVDWKAFMELERKDHKRRKESSMADYQIGKDEINLAKFPLASISDRYLDGSKTVVLEDTVWDRERKLYLPSRLTISGSDRYGLPTAQDDDVLLACVQISSLGDFADRQMFFSRYELLKLLRWKDDTKYYRRAATSLRRWLGLSVYSNRAFYDKARESWVNRDFGVIDNMDLYEKESEERKSAPPSSWLIWNEVLFASFQAGYLKRIDWDLYCRLESAAAKRLYRFLDKRFYHGNRVEIDLHELALRKVRLSKKYNVAEMKRVLLRGIEELEAKWELKRSSARFVKQGRGEWLVVFERRKRRKSKKATPANTQQVDPSFLEVALARRSIGPAVAEELVAVASTETVTTAVELFDWYNSRGQERGPGFLVNAIRKPETLRFPKGFESESSRASRKKAEKSRKGRERDFSSRQMAKRAAMQSQRDKPFSDFWQGLDEAEQQTFETDAVNQADVTKRQGYFRSMADEKLFEAYRHAILRDHFERTCDLQGEQKVAASTPATRGEASTK